MKKHAAAVGVITVVGGAFSGAASASTDTSSDTTPPEPSSPPIESSPIRWLPNHAADCAKNSCTLMGVRAGQPFYVALIGAYRGDKTKLKSLDDYFAAITAGAESDWSSTQRLLQQWRANEPIDGAIPADISQADFLAEIATYREAVKAELADPGSGSAILERLDQPEVGTSEVATGVQAMPMADTPAYGSSIIGGLYNNWAWRAEGWPYEYGAADKSGWTVYGYVKSDYETSINGRAQNFRTRWHAYDADFIGQDTTTLWCKRDVSDNPDPWCQDNNGNNIGTATFGATTPAFTSAWVLWAAYDEHYSSSQDGLRKYVEVAEQDARIIDSHGDHVYFYNPNVQTWRVFCTSDTDCHYIPGRTR